MVVALTVDGGARESDLGEVMNDLSSRPGERRVDHGLRSCLRVSQLNTVERISAQGSPAFAGTTPRKCRRPFQILPETSFCIRLAISTSRRHACSRNDITRSMSRSLGSGISILRSPSATFGSGFFSEVRLRQRLVDLAGDDRLARRQFRLEFFIVGQQPADFRIERRAFVGHGIAGPAGTGVGCRSKRRRCGYRA